MRIGMGYDIHRLVEDRKLFLGGVEIPYIKGLLGHSDGDVLLHAIADAMLEVGQLSSTESKTPKLNAAEVRLIFALRGIEGRPADGKCDEMDLVNAAVEAYIEETSAVRSLP